MGFRWSICLSNVNDSHLQMRLMPLCVSGWWNVADIGSLDDVTKMRSVKMHVVYMPLEASYTSANRWELFLLHFWSAYDGVNMLHLNNSVIYVLWDWLWLLLVISVEQLSKLMDTLGWDSSKWICTFRIQASTIKQLTSISFCSQRRPSVVLHSF